MYKYAPSTTNKYAPVFRIKYRVVVVVVVVGHLYTLDTVSSRSTYTTRNPAAYFDAEQIKDFENC